ncbi:maleylpyruvate isomerase family mycothiol-dependent enzyme [Streptomyces sp. H39-S7]|uniref:maleylpyruvate isomerase family mycothiol-dependent enzyme n=1 Tax=Streptomyces sp. H39-S7 TaxID=3004357 RepID=UPI0022AE6453|nr:maleylpyruvate isomerase family mycothiol-dependent enzyme [Streptomyces sp. H39-S7]MCZ4121190.1 maleylpyruvate isomerase family mycothiol-dependent enzyme [Streptomyces sp. H39-S7]
MSVQRPDPARDAAAVSAATERLIEAVAALPAAAVAEPSLLPGWTRGHVLAHLARNADSLVNLLTWARTGVETPMYLSSEVRDKDIADGAGRPLAEHLDDLRSSAERFALAAGEISPQAWAAQVRMRSGKVIAAAEVPWRRLAEVNFHHVDLGIGCGFDDLPAEFTGRQLDVLLDSLSGHEGVAAVRVRDTGSGASWDLGAATEPELTVSGTGNALLAWVSGRGTGEGLATEPDHALPALPPLI